MALHHVAPWLAPAAVVAVLLVTPSAHAAGPLVALGDSFSSGEGAPPFEDGTAKRGVNTCHRSLASWPVLVAGDTDRTPVSFACSGAIVNEVTRSNRKREEVEQQTSQIRRLRSVRPDLVTLTIGGNDAGFVKVLIACLTPLRPRCDLTYNDEGFDEIAREIADLEQRLPAVYRKVRAAASGAPLVVVGYPRLFPTRPRFISCTWMEDEELQYLNATGARLNAAIRRAAGKAHVNYINVGGALHGHELSCSSGSWVNPLGASRRFPYSFHPNAKGQIGLAKTVERGLRRLGLG